MKYSIKFAVVKKGREPKYFHFVSPKSKRTSIEGALKIARAKIGVRFPDWQFIFRTAEVVDWDEELEQLLLKNKGAHANKI